MTSTVARSLARSSKTSEMAPARLTTVAHKEGERENLYATEELQGSETETEGVIWDGV